MASEVSTMGTLKIKEINAKDTIKFYGSTDDTKSISIVAQEPTQAGNVNYTLPVITQARTLMHDNSTLNNSQLNSSVREQFSTGVLTGGVLSVNADDTKFDVTDGTGMIIDPSNGDETDVSWTGKTAQSGTYSGLESYVLINSSGNVEVQSTYPTRQEIREKIFLGVLLHFNATNLDDVENEQMTIANPSNGLRDLYKGVGNLKLTGLSPSKSTASTLKFQLSAGTIQCYGCNYDNNKKDPHVKSESAWNSATSDTFRYVNRDGSVSGAISDINPDIYDNGTAYNGSTPTIANNKWGVQRIYILPNGSVNVQLAQFTYTTVGEALSSINTEGFVVETELQNDGILCGFIAVQQGSTDLESATFFDAGKFGGSGAVSNISTLQQAYDNSSGDPEILIDDGGGEVRIRNGTGNGTHLVLAVQKNAGTNMLAVYADRVAIETPGVPPTTTSNGTKGTIAYNSSFLYICTATNTWRRVALSTW